MCSQLMTRKFLPFELLLMRNFLLPALFGFIFCYTIIHFYVSMYHGYEIKLNERLDLEVRRIYVLDTHLYPKQEVPPSPKKNHSFIFLFLFFFWKFWKARISEITLSCEFVYQTNFDGTSNEALILDFVSCNYERRQLIGRLQSLHIYIYIYSA